MMTDEGRAAVSEAQKKRWRKFRKGRKAARRIGPAKEWAFAKALTAFIVANMKLFR
jgi:hypothetical protein